MKSKPFDSRRDREFRPFSSDEFYPYPVYEPSPTGEQLFPPREDEFDYYPVDNDYHL